MVNYGIEPASKNVGRTVSELIGKARCELQSVKGHSMTQMALMTIYVKVQSNQKTLTLNLPAESTLQELRNLISEHSSPPDSVMAPLLFQGRQLTQCVSNKSLSALGIKANSTVTVANSSLYGGSEKIVFEQDKSFGPQFKAFDGGQNKKVDEEEVLDQSSQNLLSETCIQNENNPIIDPLHYAKQMLEDPLEVAQEFLSFEKVLMEARSQLLQGYGVPKINEPLVALDDVITQLHEQLYTTTSAEGTSVWDLNSTLVDMYVEYDIEKRDSIGFDEFVHLIEKFMKLLRVPYEEKSLKLIARIVDVNQDGRYSKEEIVCNYTKEEIKEQFQIKRQEVELKIQQFKDDQAKSKEKIKAEAQVQKKSKEKGKSQPKKDSKVGVEPKLSDSSQNSDKEKDHESKSEQSSSEDDPGVLLENLEEQREWYDADKEEEAQQQNAEFDPNGDYNELYGENFIARLARLNEQQKKEIKLFAEKMQENRQITMVLDDLIDRLSRHEQWFQKLTEEQLNLLTAIFILSFRENPKLLEDMKTSRLGGRSEMMSWDQLLDLLDLKAIVHLIICLGPSLFRLSTIAKDYNLDLIGLVELVESANSSGLLNLVKQIVEGYDQRETPEKVLESLGEYFSNATLPQKRLLLQMTNSIPIKKEWLGKLEPMQIVELVRPQLEIEKFDYNSLQICSSAKVEEVKELLTTKEIRQLSIWQLQNALGFPQPEFSDLEQNQKDLVHKINLSIETKHIFQMPNPSVPGEILRVEQQSNEHNTTLSQPIGQEQSLEQCPGAETCYYITKSKFSQDLGKLEAYQQVQIEKPLGLKTGSYNVAGLPVLFTGLNGEIFFFTKNIRKSTCLLNILEGKVIKQVLIDEGSHLYDYVTKGNEKMKNYGEYNQVDVMYPQAEPTLMKVKDDTLVIFSFFRWGSKPSVCVYSTQQKRELLQLSGANEFMFHLRENEHDPASKQYFILLAEPKFGKPVFQDENQFADYMKDRDDEPESTLIHFKRFQFDYESLLQCHSKQIVEVLSDYDQESDKIALTTEGDMVAEALIANDSDWIGIKDSFKPTLDQSFHTVVRHTGPENRKFFALQSTNEPGFMMCNVYEVLNSNNLKLLFSRSKYCEEKETIAFLMTGEKDTNPNVLLIDLEDKLISQIDLLQERKKKKSLPLNDDKQELTESASESEYDDMDCFEGEITNVPDHTTKIVLLAEMTEDQLELFSISEDEDEMGFAAISQPCLTKEGIILMSSLNLGHPFIEMQVQKQSVEHLQNRKEIEQKYGRFIQAKAEVSTYQLNSADAWKMGFSFPLMACASTERADEIIVSSMASGMRDQVLLKLKFGQINCFVQSDTEKQDSDVQFNFLSHTRDNDRWKTRLITLKLNMCYKKGSLTKGWQISKVDFSDQKLHELKNKIQSVKLIKAEADSYDFQLGLLCKTNDSILLITQKDSKVVFQSLGDESLTHTKMIHSQRGQHFFLSQELSSQTFFLNEFSANYDLQSKTFHPKCQKVFTFTSGSIVDIQLDRDVEQQNSLNYSYDRQVVKNDTDSKTALMVLDSNLNVSKLEQTQAGAQFVEVFSRSLNKHESLKQALSQKKEDESLVMSERALIFRDQVHVLDSHKVYDALPGSLREDKNATKSEIIPNSDKIMYKVIDSKQLVLFFKRDAGRRNCSPIGTEQIRDCLSADFISKHLMLLNIRTKSDAENYWTLVTIDEQVKELTQELEKLLTAVERGFYSRVKSRIIRGNICQLLILQSKNGTDSEAEIQRTPISTIQHPVVVELSSQGNVLSTKTFKIDLKKELRAYDDTDLLQNYAGLFLQVVIEQFADHHKGETESTPRVIPGEELENKSEIKPAVFLFEKGIVGTEYLYAGDYFCWRAPNETFFTAINVEQAVAQSEKLVADEEETPKLKKVDFSEFVGKTKSHMIGISEQQPYVLSRMTHSNSMSDNKIRKLANRIQLTMESRALVFDLNEEIPVPVEEISAMHQLSNPHNFVENVVSLQTFQQKKSVQWEVQELKIKMGNRIFGLQTYFEPSQQGNMILVKQKSNLPIQRSHENDIDLRPVLGMYRSFCEVDLMEARSLINASEDGRKPKQIDLKTIWASYGDQILFSLLNGNLRVLTSIRDSFEKQEFEDREDTDGTTSLHPDMLRLDGILTRKTFAEFTQDRTKMQLQSFLQRNLTNSGLRDAMLKIGRFSPNFSVLKVFESQEHFGQMIQQSTPQTTLELENCFCETRTTRQVQLLDWPREIHLLTMLSDKCTINKEEINKLLASHENKVTRAVQVSKLNIKWFYHRKNPNFVAFTQILQNLPSKVYDSIFVESLLDQFWTETQMHIIKYQFAPYLTFVTLSLWYYVNALDRRTAGDDINSYTRWLIWLDAPVLFALWCYQVYLEIKQIGALNKKLDYFKNIWNWNDIISLSITLLVLICSVTYEPLLPIADLRLAASISSCTLLIKVFDWLRLFEKTAFYILLVGETFAEIMAFMILLFVALLMFGVPMIMLNLNRSKEDGNEVIAPAFGHWSADMIVNQYMLSLGEFNYENFADQPNAAFCFGFFIASTFITQLVMLNMLIAIMGDTFERVIENRDVNATKTKLELMCDLVSTLQQTGKPGDEKKYFMFIVMPDDDQVDDEDDWEGSVNKITRLTSESINAQCDKLHKQNAQLQDSFDEFVKKDVVSDKHLRAHVDKLVKSIKSDVLKAMGDKMDTMEQKNTEQFAQMMKIFGANKPSEHKQSPSRGKSRQNDMRQSKAFNSVLQKSTVKANVKGIINAKKSFSIAANVLDESKVTVSELATVRQTSGPEISYASTIKATSIDDQKKE